MANRLYRKLGYMFAMGTEVGVLVGGGAVLGTELDKLFDTGPWLFLAVLFLGVVTAFWRVIFYARAISKDSR